VNPRQFHPAAGFGKLQNLFDMVEFDAPQAPFSLPDGVAEQTPRQCPGQAGKVAGPRFDRPRRNHQDRPSLACDLDSPPAFFFVRQVRQVRQSLVRPRIPVTL
jgi:hypothetical protein